MGTRDTVFSRVLYVNHHGRSRLSPQLTARHNRRHTSEVPCFLIDRTEKQKKKNEIDSRRSPAPRFTVKKAVRRTARDRRGGAARLLPHKRLRAYDVSPGERAD